MTDILSKLLAGAPWWALLAAVAVAAIAAWEMWGR